MELTTANGTKIHPIGIGTWGIASEYNADFQPGIYGTVRPAKDNEPLEIDAIGYSINKGQNHLDCAELYGAFYTDEVVGKAIATSGADRQSLYIADKLWKHSVLPGAAQPTVEQMLTKLQTDYIDLLYIHAPWENVDWQAAIPQIDALIYEGIVRHFGVSNFTIAQMNEARAIAKHPLAANQMNFNCLYRDEVDDEFRAYCAEHDIQIVAYQPVKRGEVTDHPVLNDIAEMHGATAAQVALAWLIQLGALPIPKAVKTPHIDENAAAVDLILTNEDVERISAI